MKTCQKFFGAHLPFSCGEKLQESISQLTFFLSHIKLVLLGS